MIRVVSFAHAGDHVREHTMTVGPSHRHPPPTSSIRRGAGRRRTPACIGDGPEITLKLIYIT
eukprot:2519556-Pleurochrysis_carterae.AAC.1